MNNDLTKKYYRIGEVAELLGLPISTLRFWESKFTIIKPRRNAKGTRYYTPDDVEKIRSINFLVKEKGMKLDAAQEELRKNSEMVDRRSEVIERLRGIRSRVQQLLDAVDTRDHEHKRV